MEGRKLTVPYLIHIKAAESSENKNKNRNTLLERQSSHLSRHRAELVRRIPTMSVVDRLSDLHGDPEEQIKSILDREGDGSANRQLLKSVMRYDDGYVKLVKALEKIGGMTNLVEKLSKDEEGLSLMEEVEHTGPIHRYDKQVALQGGVEDSAASSYDTLVAASLSQSQKRTYYQSLGVKQPLENIDQEVTTESLRDLSGKIPTEWKDVGRNLGLKDPQLCILERDNNNQGHKETIHEMLLAWKHSNGSNATYRVLGQALIAAGRTDLQEELYEQECYPVFPFSWRNNRDSDW